MTLSSDVNIENNGNHYRNVFNHLTESHIVTEHTDTLGKCYKSPINTLIVPWVGSKMFTEIIVTATPFCSTDTNALCRLTFDMGRGHGSVAEFMKPRITQVSQTMRCSFVTSSEDPNNPGQANVVGATFMNFGPNDVILKAGSVLSCLIVSHLQNPQ